MLTKEECKQALDHFEKCYWDQDNSYSAMNGVRKDLDILNELINEHFEIIDKLKRGELSDGYHTFNELYHHRAVLFSVILNQNKDVAWKAKKHHDGTMYDGMFIVGINTPQGQYSYHYDLNLWSLFDIKELEYAPEWDGHKPKDIDRLQSLNDNPPLKFDELNKSYPIYDNDEIVCGWKFIYMIDKEYKQLLLIDEEGNVDWVNYEENRFYRKEVQE